MSGHARNAAESHYPPVEGEALVVTDALYKARFFVLGCSDLIIAVDHKPLLKVFSDRSHEEISNNRLCNLKEKTLCYKFTWCTFLAYNTKLPMQSPATLLAP